MASAVRFPGYDCPFKMQLRSSSRQVSKTRSAIYLTMVTSAGLLRNKHSGVVQSEVTLDDLFRA